MSADELAMLIDVDKALVRHCTGFSTGATLSAKLIALCATLRTVRWFSWNFFFNLQEYNELSYLSSTLKFSL